MQLHNESCEPTFYFLYKNGMSKRAMVDSGLSQRRCLSATFCETNGTQINLVIHNKSALWARSKSLQAIVNI
jgi:hypothetical protein